MEDVLLPIGSLIKGAPDGEEQRLYLIVGRRIINHETMCCWDYVSVPFDEGMKRNIEGDKKHFENFYYFNHYDIDEIVKVNDYKEAQIASRPEEE